MKAPACFVLVFLLAWIDGIMAMKSQFCQDCFIPGYSCGLQTSIRAMEKVPVDDPEAMATGCIQITDGKNWQKYLLSKPSK